MNRGLRFVAFTIVGLGGVAVQLASLALLVAWGVHYLPATAAAVLLSVVHNFLWHRWWTWRDRRGAAARSTFIRFVLANGAVSLAGNLGIMATLVGGAGMPPIAANLVSIAVCGLLSFWISDSFVFGQSSCRDHSRGDFHGKSGRRVAHRGRAGGSAVWRVQLHEARQDHRSGTD